MNRADDWMQDGECVSALVDGQLPDTALVRTLELLQSSSRARAAWANYHLVREALQTGQAWVSTDDAEFAARLRQRLATGSPQAAPMVQPQPVQPPRPTRSANDTRFRRVVGLASVALVAVVAWQALQQWPAAAGGSKAQLAQSVRPALPADGALDLTALEHEPVFAATQPVMLRDARLDALLAAHRPWTSYSALQTPSGLVRNASFEEVHR